MTSGLESPHRRTRVLAEECLYKATSSIGTIQPCGEYKTLFSANFEVRSCDRMRVLPCAPVVHLLADTTPRSTAFDQDHVRHLVKRRYLWRDTVST